MEYCTQCGTSLERRDTTLCKKCQEKRMVEYQERERMQAECPHVNVTAHDCQVDYGAPVWAYVCDDCGCIVEYTQQDPACPAWHPRR